MSALSRTPPCCPQMWWEDLPSHPNLTFIRGLQPYQVTASAVSTPYSLAVMRGSALAMSSADNIRSIIQKRC